MSFLNDDPEVRRAEKVYEKPNWLVGKRTYIGLAITMAGMIGKRFGWTLPQEEVNNLLDVLLANWDALAEVSGSALAVFGSIQKAVLNKRLKKAVVVQKVIAERVEEKLAAKTDELIDTRTKLIEAKAELKKATE